MSFRVKIMKGTGTQRIETERLILRQMVIDDASDMYNYWASDPLVSRFFTWEPHESIETTKYLIENWAAAYSDPYCFHWIIFCKECDHTIGTIYIDDVDQADLSGVVSCILSRDYWGKGIAAEATKAVIGYAFNEAGFAKIFAHHHEDNAASGRALVKAGFSFLNKAYHEYEKPGINGNYYRYVIEK